MTSSTVINGITTGTLASNRGSFVNPVKIALGVDTTICFISLKVTLPPDGFDRQDEISAYFANSQTNYATALDGCIALRSGARYVSLKLFPGQTQKLLLERSSDAEIAASGYQYIWLEAPTTSAGLTVSVILNELP